MKIKLTLALLTCMPFYALTQTQINVVKKPVWNVVNSYDSRYGTKTDISDHATAMIVNVPKADFAVVTLDEKMSQKWLTELAGFPMAIGKFKNQVLVIAASDRSYFKSFNNTFKAYVLDEQTGKIISDKIIYEGSKDFVEAPDFFFAKDGSYFKMASRLTGMKRKLRVGLPVIAFLTVLKAEKDYAETQNYTFIDFNERLEQIQKTQPRMPEGDTWNAFCGDDGSFMISTADGKNRTCNVALYLSSNPSPLKTLSIPVDFYQGGEISSISYASSKTPLVNYFAISYKNADKEQALLIAKVDFNLGTYQLNKEVLDKTHLKELYKSFVPVNKKFDALDFGGTNHMNVRHIAEYGDKILIGVSSRYSLVSRTESVTYEGSVLLNVYDRELKPVYHQFIPRSYKSVTGEGSDVAYNLNGNTLRMLANQKDGGSVATMYGEMDLNNGHILKLNLLPKADIRSVYYANTSSVSWLGDSFIIPFMDHIRMLTNKVDVQLLQLSYR